MMFGGLQSQNARPPSVSPYIIRENRARRSSEKPLPKILTWIAPSLKKGKRDRLPTLDDEGQVATVSQSTNDWVNRHGNPAAFHDEHDRNSIQHGLPGGVSAQNRDNHILPLLYEIIQDYNRRRYGDYGLPPDAYQHRYAQSTGQYPPPSNTGFDQQAQYINRGDPLRLLPVPETAPTAFDDHASDLTLDLYDPRSSTAVDPNRRFPGPNTGTQAGNLAPFDAEDRSRSGGPQLSRGNHGIDTVSTPGIGYDRNLVKSTHHPPGRVHRSHQPSEPMLDSLIAKYTMLDDNYPTDGESMHIAREEDPPAELENGVDEEQKDRERDSDGGSNVET